MPRFMKADAIHLINGGIESYLLSLYGLNLPAIRERKIQEIRYAPILGLLGATVELLVKSCLVQAYGVQAMYKNNDIASGVYKYGTEVIEEFRQGVKNNKSEFSFVWKNPVEYVEQQQEFLVLVAKFKLLQDLRAKGLHAGIGCSKDVVIAIANDTYSFIKMLSSSKKIGAYLKNIPAPETPVKDREAILEDLSRRFANLREKNQKLDCLRGMYLVLPYIPDIEPEWLSVFDRVQVTPPTDEDINYLIRSLTEAHSIYLLKNRSGKEGIPVRIEPNNPVAVPIAIQNIKRELNSIPDQFNNDCLTANTRLNQKRLDLPIDDFIIDLYAIGIENSGILIPPINMLTAQQSWAYIAAAIQTQGTPRPYWFIVKKCDEIVRLKDFLQQANKIGNAYLRKRMPIVLKGIQSLIDNTELVIDDDKENILIELKANYESCLRSKAAIKQILTPTFIKKNLMSEEVSSVLGKYLEGSINIGTALEKILLQEILTDSDKKIARQLLNTCYEYDNRNGLVAVLRTNHLEGYKSEARKIMYFSDFIKNGPNISGIDSRKF